MKIKLGKVFDFALPLLAGLVANFVQSRAEKRAEKDEKKVLDKGD